MLAHLFQESRNQLPTAHPRLFARRSAAPPAGREQPPPIHLFPRGRNPGQHPGPQPQQQRRGQRRQPPSAAVSGRQPAGGPAGGGAAAALAARGAVAVRRRAPAAPQQRRPGQCPWAVALLQRASQHPVLPLLSAQACMYPVVSRPHLLGCMLEADLPVCMQALSPRTCSPNSASHQTACTGVLRPETSRAVIPCACAAPWQARQWGELVLRPWQGRQRDEPAGELRHHQQRQRLQRLVSRQRSIRPPRARACGCVLPVDARQQSMTRTGRPQQSMTRLGRPQQSRRPWWPVRNCKGWCSLSHRWRWSMLPPIKWIRAG